jgi:enoyl-CoA hydratase
MSSVYSFFNVATADGVSYIEFNRPNQLNAMNTAFWVELPQLIRALDAEGKTRVAVLHGAGRLFSAGIDISMFSGETALTTESVAQRESFRQQLIALQRTLEVLAQARFPVIAAVHGACLGAGVDLVTACCLRYATRDAYFCIEEINIGMMADVGTLQRIPKQLSDAVVRELAYTGDKLAAERAERLGFVNAIFDTQEQMMAAVAAVAKKIASKSPIAVASTKKMVSYSRDHSVAESFEMLNAMQPAIFSSSDIQRAMLARRIKEAPEFADLPPIAPPIPVSP